MNQQILNLAIAIADESAECDIRSLAHDPQFETDGTWKDIAPLERFDAQLVNRAVQYLELRGLLERHPDHPNCVRVKKPDAQTEKLSPEN